ncbi:hypothetical protein RhiJN_26068 [Ceratobasidium sp. AG-Ba]|nr:hypothetical protein RhiJN_26068 [Ceratobasidium sp. AG-Ba]
MGSLASEWIIFGSSSLFHNQSFSARCLFVTGVCILFYDHMLTFSDEVRYVWKQKWSIVSTIFVLNRYVTPFVIAVDLYDKGGLSNYLPYSFCITWYYLETFWVISSFAMTHAIIALRVHAIWGRPKWLSITLSVAFVLYYVATAVLAYKAQIEVVSTLGYSPLFRICFVHISPRLWLCWVPALVFETFMFALTVIKAKELSKGSFDTPVIRILYRDGFIYFVVICCCSLFNMMVWLAAPPTLAALPKYFVTSLIPTMGARLVLNLRSSRPEDIMPTGRATTTTEGTVGYELSAKGAPGSTRPVGRFTFGSIRGGETYIEEEERHLSAQERIELNQIKGTKLGAKGVASLA